MRFRYTILYVADIEATLEFYRRAFGLDAGFVHPGGDYAELATGDTRLAFAAHALAESLGKRSSRPDPAAPAFVISLETDQVAADVDRALEAGATLVQAPRLEPWQQTTACVADPNGFVIEICSPVTARDATESG